jgi:Tfp pilus assembly protein FimV
MTATLYPAQRADRVTPRPVGRTASGSTSSSTSRASSVGTPADPGANYAVRRAVAALVVVLLVAGVAIAGSVLVGALVDVGGRPAAASVGPAAELPSVRIHVAQPGDTLWSIADRYRGDVDRGRFVDALVDANGGTVIQIGQAVRLP